MLPPSSSLEVKRGRPALVLAPMEGVTDAPMRALQAERGGFTYCVSEFLRISQDLPPARTYFEHVPELQQNCRTPSGHPVQIQLLGGDAEKMALAAQRACELGASGIDLNFGCPAPTVNRHDGGATLLKYPDRLRQIVAAVRAAVPGHLPVSAKLRLGFDSMDSIHINAERVAEGGASWITIHGRTKVQGYIPPAYWLPIGQVNRNLGIPVIANGEIWTLDDFKRCRDETGCEHFMLGRGALADPALPLAVARELGLPAVVAVPAGHASIRPFRDDAERWKAVLLRFCEITGAQIDHPHYRVRRIKQWTKMAHLRFQMPWFERLKTAQTLDEVFEALRHFATA